MKQIYGKMPWCRRARTVLRTPLLFGALILSPFALKAQQKAATPPPPVRDSVKVLCNAAKSYLERNPAEVQRLKQATEQALQSPEMQQAMLVVIQHAMTAMQDTIQKRGDVRNDLNLGAIPDSLWVPFAAAVASRRLDSAKVIARKTIGSTPVDSAMLDITFKFLEVTPDTLRSLLVAGMRLGDAGECDLLGTP